MTDFQGALSGLLSHPDLTGGRQRQRARHPAALWLSLIFVVSHLNQPEKQPPSPFVAQAWLSPNGPQRVSSGFYHTLLCADESACECTLVYVNANFMRASCRVPSQSSWRGRGGGKEEEVEEGLALFREVLAVSWWGKGWDRQDSLTQTHPPAHSPGMWCIFWTNHVHVCNTGTHRKFVNPLKFKCVSASFRARKGGGHRRTLVCD